MVYLFQLLLGSYFYFFIIQKVNTVWDIDSIDIAPRIITKDIYVKNISHFRVTTSIQGGVTALTFNWLAQSVGVLKQTQGHGFDPILSIMFSLFIFFVQAFTTAATGAFVG